MISWYAAADEGSSVEEAENEVAEERYVGDADEDAALEGDEEGKPVKMRVKPIKKFVKAGKADMGDGSSAN